MASRRKDTDNESSDGGTGRGMTDAKVRYWLAEIEAAKKREKDFRKDGIRIREIYHGEKAESTPFNLLFSNTETILPSLYSAIPRPVVQRRYKDDDPIGLAAATAGQRMLEFLVDTNIDGYETFHEGLKSATLDGLLPGRGVTAIKYDYEGEDVLKAQLVCPESKSWNRVYFGYAKKWSAVPWVAYEIHFDRKEAKKKFGDKAARMVFTHEEDDEENSQGGRKNADESDRGERRTCCVYQIWDKRGGKKIRYVSNGYKEGILLEEEDPLGLTGFFNTPKPLQFVEKTDEMTPTAMYLLYENQAKELNRITVRINRIVEAMKARGIYDSALGGDIANLMDADENELVPAEKEGSFAAEKGIGNAIWFMPLDQLVATLQQLYLAREQTKQTIYEIMGISDILRGSSKASETLGAQQIKNQWGSLRLKPKQMEVQRYARDLLRMMLEIAATKFNEDTWARMTGLPYLTQSQAQQAQQVGMALQQKAQMGDPKAQQQYQQMMAQLQETPTWAAVLETLGDDMQRAYKIDIETNSTVEPEAVEDKKDITEMMAALSQFLNGVAPLVERGSLPFEAAQAMMLAISRRFRFGADIEQYLKKMQAPKPPEEGGDGGEAAAQAEGKVTDVKIKAAEERMQNEAKVKELTDKLRAAQLENQAIARKGDQDVRELKLTLQEKMLKQQQASAQRDIQTQKKVAIGEVNSKSQIAAAKQKAASAGGKPAPKTGDSGGAASMMPPAADNDSSQQVMELAGMVEKLFGAVASQAQQMQQLLVAVKSPRRKKAIRGPDGKIAEVIEQIEDEGGGTLQ